MEDEILESCSTKVLVSGLTPKISRDKLFAHFQNSNKSGGGEIKSLTYTILQNEEVAAVVEYFSNATAQSVLRFPQQSITLKKISLDVSEYKQGLFESTTVVLNPLAFEDSDSYKQIEQLVDEAGLTKSEGNVATFCGEWGQMLYFNRKLQELACNKVNDNAAGHTSRIQSQPTSSLVDDKTVNGQGPQDRVSNELEFNLHNGEDRSVVNLDRPSVSAGVDPIEDQESINKEGSGVTLDNDIFAYMQLNKKDEIEYILRSWKARVQYLDDSVSVEFLSNPAEEGISRLQKIYQDTMENVVQINCDLPLDFDGKNAWKLFGQVREKHPLMHVSMMGEYNRALFIGCSKGDCNEAIGYFKYILEKQSNGPRHPLSQTNGELFRHKFPDTGLVVSICQGDIAKQNTGAIVNAANQGLRNGAGVTGAIFRAGGENFERSCGDLIARRRRELDIGEVVHTSACGRLQCKWVLHVAGPRWYDLTYSKRRETCQDIMNKLCWELIDYSNRTVGVSSVAIPAIGTGIYGVPMSVFCEAMLYGIREFQKVRVEGKQPASLDEIRLVNFNRVEADKLVSNLRGKFASNDGETRV